VEENMKQLDWNAAVDRVFERNGVRLESMEFDFSLPVFNDPVRLIEFRNVLGIGQVELADEAEVSQGLISAIERGDKKFTEPSRTKIWKAIHRLMDKKAKRTIKENPGKVDYFRFKTPLEMKDEEIELLKSQRDLARQQRDTLKQLVDMNLLDRCVELEQQLAAALKANADYVNLFALRGSSVAGDELESEIEQRLREGREK
jgi:transcriptional regulator with XRE-family HTH domain